jgi:hypothetical protein
METLNALMGGIDAALTGQSQAAQEGDAQQSALLSERGAALIEELRAQIRAGEGGAALQALVPALRRFRDVATYNQLLLRYAFTSWAALCLDRERRAIFYDARGHLTRRDAASAGSPRRVSLGVL